MSIDAAEEEYLYVAPSGIPGAGQGLFTAIPVHRGEVVAIYTGEVLTAAEALRDLAGRIDPRQRIAHLPGQIRQ